MTTRRGKSNNTDNGEALNDQQSSQVMSSAASDIEIEHRKWLAMDKLYATPNFQIRHFQEHEKLMGHKNFKTWRAMLNLDLKALNLHPFIESECGMTINVSPGRRVVLDAQTMQYIRASVSKSIAARISNTTFTAYKTMEALEKMFGGNRVQDLVTLHERLQRLRFKAGYDPDRFIADFEQIIEDYTGLGTTYSEEYIKTLFLHKIEGINDPKSHFFTFYTTMSTLRDVTFDEIKEKFVTVVENIPKQYNKRKFDGDSKVQNVDQPTKFRKLDPPKEKFKPETSGKARSLKDKYTSEQLDKLSKMTREEKKKVQCTKCGEYYHTKNDCKNPGRMCFQCFQYGHERKDCTVQKGNFYNIDMFGNNISFFIDSCASHHIVNSRDLLMSFSMYENPISVKTASKNSDLYAIGEGSLPILVNFGKTKSIIRLHGVQYLPNADECIISVSKLNQQFKTSLMLNPKTGFILCRRLKRKIASITETKGIYEMHAKTIDLKNLINSTSPDLTDLNKYKVDNDLFVLLTQNTPQSESVVQETRTTSNIKRKRNRRSKLTTERITMLEQEGDLWHRRMGHISSPILHKLKSVTAGVNDFVTNVTLSNCTVCAQAKQHRKSFNKDRERATRPCAIVHVDLMGPISPPTFEKRNIYIMCVIDDYTRFLQVFLMKSKSSIDVVPCLSESLRFLQANFPGAGQFNILRCDQGTEFNNESIDQILDKYGIVREISEPYCHEHNGLVERLNRRYCTRKSPCFIVRIGISCKFVGTCRTGSLLYLQQNSTLKS